MNGKSHVNKIILMMIISVCFLSFVFADEGTFYVNGGNLSQNTTEVTNCGAVEGITLLLDYPDYVGFNEIQPINVRVKNFSNNYLGSSEILMQLNADDGWYNMTYDGSSKWQIWLTGNVSENSSLLVKMTSDIYACVNESFTIRFRQPYWVTFRFYSGVNTSSGAQEYISDFDYVYMYVDETPTNQMKTPSYLGGILDFMAMMPIVDDWYSAHPSDLGFDKDAEFYFWNKYEAGEVTIKLYELQQHQLAILGTDTMIGDVSIYQQFDKPWAGDYKWQTAVTLLDFDDIFNGEPQNATFSIYLKPWEANKAGFFLQLVKWLFIIGILMGIIILELMFNVPAKIILYTITAYGILVGGIGWIF